MKVTASFGPPRSTRTWATAWLCSMLLVVMLLTQLYGFDDFAITLGTVLPINDAHMDRLLSGLVVIGELLALPYLLGMYLSTLMRLVCVLAAFLVSGFWLLLALTSAHAENSGLFSSTIDLPGGIVAALWSLLLFGLLISVILADSRFRHTSSSS